MKLRAIRLRQHGVPVSRHDVANAPGVLGDMKVVELRDDVLLRYTRTARLTDPAYVTGRDLVPPLRDVQLLHMLGDGFVIAGFEREGETDYAQSWLCRNAVSAP
ncbi:MAG: hypothetical protein E6R14_08655 [Thermomicrobiales bacterium]|jgi:hypothetical protein|nr:MAG: hypothetical protein E6R14_08655 [Thermomicrobiales bacterium]